MHPNQKGKVCKSTTTAVHIQVMRMTEHKILEIPGLKPELYSCVISEIDLEIVKILLFK
jgi:16S rRNA U1498 N3-methylase RsmE